MNDLIFNKQFDELNKARFSMIAINNITCEIKEERIQLLEAVVLSNIRESKSQARSLVLQKSIERSDLEMNCMNLNIHKADPYLKHYTVIQKGKKDCKILK